MASIILIGYSHNSLRIASELRRSGKDFIVLPGAALASADLKILEQFPHMAGDPASTRTLEGAGISEAECVIIAGDRDTENLSITLLVREMNPRAKIILRLFNLKLGEKLSTHLGNCFVLSTSGLSAPSFAGSSLFRHAFFSFRRDNTLYSFIRLPLGCASAAAGRRREELEAAYGTFVIMAADSKGTRPREEIELIPDEGSLYLFMESRHMGRLVPLLPLESKPPQPPRSKARLKPDRFIAAVLFIVFLIVALSTAYFHRVHQYSLLDSLYFVVTTMSTVGYGDYSLREAFWFSKVVGIGLMLSGISLTAIFFALLTNLVIQKRTDYLEGRRRFRLRDHIIVCGLGSLGYKIVDALILLGEKVLVIEKNRENPFINDLASRNVPFMVADAALERTLLDANLLEARSMICAMSDDLICLEIGLTARRLHPAIRLVLRIFDEGLAEKIQNHFNIHSAFSTSSLSAPSFVALSLGENVLAVVPFEGRQWAVAERRGAGPSPPGAIDLPYPGSMVLYPL